MRMAHAGRHCEVSDASRAGRPVHIGEAGLQPARKKRYSAPSLTARLMTGAGAKKAVNYKNLSVSEEDGRKPEERCRWST